MSATDPGVGPDIPIEPLEAAEDHVTRRVPIVDPATTAGDIRALLAGQPFDSVAAVAVVEGERLAGLVSIDVVRWGVVSSFVIRSSQVDRLTV